MGCAVATAAMLADLSYEEVNGLELDNARMRWPQELHALLEAVTDTKWQLLPCWHPLKPLHEFSFPPYPVGVFINDSALCPQFGQWIVLKNEIVHDPCEWTAYAASRYPRRDWVVTCVAQPVRPAELAQRKARLRQARLRNVLLW
jgi:hypothetical protein